MYKIWLSPNLTQLTLSPLNYSILNVEVFVRFKLNPIEVNVLLLENILAWYHSLHCNLYAKCLASNIFESTSFYIGK